MQEKLFNCKPISAHRLWYFGQDVGIAVEHPGGGWFVVIHTNTEKPKIPLSPYAVSATHTEGVRIHPDLKTAAEYAWFNQCMP